MMISRKKKIGGIIFAICVLILMGISLTPALLSEPGNEGYGYGYGYGYCSPATPGYLRNPLPSTLSLIQDVVIGPLYCLNFLSL